MSFLSNFAISGRVSRIAVIGALGCGVFLTGCVVYVRNFESNPMKLMRDADGVVRWMSRKQEIERRLELARSRADASNSGDKSAVLSVKMWEAALEGENARLHAAGGEAPQLKAEDLRL